MSTKLPQFLKRYFWDVDFEQLDIVDDRQMIIKRVVDRGNTAALRWLLQHYRDADIRQIIISSRDISAKTATFWAHYYQLDTKHVTCLQKPYTPIPFGVSNS